MTDIHAAQHIYGNVEKAESPSNIGGFQTLFYSKDLLSESESDEIERRLGYYPSEDNPEKIVFFNMGEKFVTTQIIPLEDIDKFGRKGAYIAHSFVFSKKDFEKINYNPFVIFDLFQQKFIKTVPDALASGKKGDLNIPPIEFTINPEKIQSLETAMSRLTKQWNLDGIRKLVFLAINEQKLKNESKSFIISGTQNEIRNTIKAIFSLIPDKVRSSCSFDTYFLGCNPVSIKYWTYCYPKAPNTSPQLILANTDTKTVSNINIDASSPYENWIFRSDVPDDIEELDLFRNTAFELDQYLSNKTYNKKAILESIKSPNLETFLIINQSLLQTKIDSSLKEISLDSLMKYISKAIISEYNPKPKAALFEKLFIGFERDEIAHYVFNEIKGINSPKNQEISDLNIFLLKNKNPLLQIVYLKWTENLDNLPKFLKPLTDEEYKTAIELLIYNADIKSLIIDSKISVFTDVFCVEAEKSKALRERTLDLIKKNFSLDQEPLLVKIVPLIPKLNRIQMIAIQEFFTEQKEEKRKKIPEEFTKTLKENIEKSKEKGGLLNLDNLVSNFPFFKKK
jgi:hypothetical protein